MEQNEQLKTALLQMMETIQNDPSKIEHAVNALKSVSNPEPTEAEKTKMIGDNVKGTKAHMQKQIDEAIPLTEIIISFGGTSFVIKPQNKAVRDIYMKAVQTILPLMDKEADHHYSQAKSQLKLENHGS